MKQAGVMSFVLGIFLLVVATTTSADEHQTPIAPQDYLDMENVFDEDDADDVFLKKAYRTYKSKCSKCHGAEGDGEGSAAEDIEIKPTAFNVPGYMDDKSDGQLFWITLYGSDGTEMESVGPDSDVGLSEEKLWQLIAYIRRTFTR